ncbi:MAG: hypothetical protein AB9842_03890 [Bacteroidales bacterium]
MNKFTYFTAFIVLMILSSCVSERYLPRPDTYPMFVKGAIFVGKMQNSTGKFKGELLCATKDSITILNIGNPYNENEIYTLPTHKLYNTRLRMTTSVNSPAGFITWSILLVPFTITHGWFAILSMPLNFINMVAVIASVSSGFYTIEIPVEMNWEEASKFARFPQGWPEGLKKEDLQ